jgi:hypothetical protein
MNSKFIASTVIALSALAGASAFAQTATSLFPEYQAAVTPVLSSSNVTRAQVQAEYFQARKDGTLPASPEGFYVAAPAKTSTVTRAEVRNDAVVSARAVQLGNSAS